MSNFTTRVELYGTPSYEVYENLHKQMEARKFSRTITSTDSKVLWLPNAEYTTAAYTSTVEVRDAAKQAAASVWKDFGVLVTRTEVTREWHNLKPHIAK